MTRKHFKAIATALNNFLKDKEINKKLTKEERLLLVDEMIKELRGFNPLFKKDTFEMAVLSNLENK